MRRWFPVVDGSENHTRLGVVQDDRPRAGRAEQPGHRVDVGQGANLDFPAAHQLVTGHHQPGDATLPAHD